MDSCVQDLYFLSFAVPSLFGGVRREQVLSAIAQEAGGCDVALLGFVLCCRLRLFDWPNGPVLGCLLVTIKYGMVSGEAAAIDLLGVLVLNVSAAHPAVPSDLIRRTVSTSLLQSASLEGVDLLDLECTRDYSEGCPRGVIFFRSCGCGLESGCCARMGRCGGR